MSENLKQPELELAYGQCTRVNPVANVQTNNELLDGELIKKNYVDAGWDVKSSEDTVVPARGSKLISTGLKINLLPGYVALLWSRSGLSVKNKIEVGAGCIDCGYTGEVKVHLYNHGDEDFNINVGDRIAQLLTMPIVLTPYTKVDEPSLLQSQRGADGFGSTGLS